MDTIIPLADYVTHGVGLGADWSALARERDQYAAKHQNFALDMDIALIAAHVTPLDMDSLEPEPEPEPEFCPDCHGRGIQHVPATGAPWRTVQMPCHRCG